MHILLTGIAGFIGFHTAKNLLNNHKGHSIVGVDNINDYYDTQLKYDRLEQLGITLNPSDTSQKEQLVKSSKYPNLSFLHADITNKTLIQDLFASQNFDDIIHLAAQAGARYSLINPQSYIDNNVTGFLNILESCRMYPVKHLVYASSSSVYGLNTKLPFSENDRTDSPASLYAATKKMNEEMAQTYAHLFSIPASGLRFFTVYGPWGRPDMSPIIFANNILTGKPIQLFNDGNMQRDFTYIDDIVKGIIDLLPHPSNASIPHAIFNIGNNTPVNLKEFVSTLEGAMGKKTIVSFAPMQAGDVKATWADVDKLRNLTGFAPSTPLKVGLEKFAEWYKEYYAPTN